MSCISQNDISIDHRHKPTGKGPNLSGILHPARICTPCDRSRDIDLGADDDLRCWLIRPAASDLASLSKSKQDSVSETKELDRSSERDVSDPPMGCQIPQDRKPLDGVGSLLIDDALLLAEKG